MSATVKKARADLLLVAQGLAESRTLAQRLIGAGQVRIGADRVVAKPNDLFPVDTEFRVETPCPYVSRGAFKLLAGLDAFPLKLTGLVVLDVGASTGGFTDLVLQRGARRVYAVDVGTGQLHWKLRQDPRVVCLERLNSRFLDASQVPELVDLLVADVSFISLRLALPMPAKRLRPGGRAYVLVKPQFEAGRAEANKGGGVVRDPAVRERCVREVAAFAESALGWRELGVVPSPITGPAGNQEYIAVFASQISMNTDVSRRGAEAQRNDKTADS